MSDECRDLGFPRQEKRGPEAPLPEKNHSRILVSMLAGGLLHRNVAEGAELRGKVNRSVVVSVHVAQVPLDGRNTREGTVDGFLGS